MKVIRIIPVKTEIDDIQFFNAKGDTLEDQLEEIIKGTAKLYQTSGEIFKDAWKLLKSILEKHLTSAGELVAFCKNNFKLRDDIEGIERLYKAQEFYNRLADIVENKDYRDLSILIYAFFATEENPEDGFLNLVTFFEFIYEHETSYVVENIEKLTKEFEILKKAGKLPNIPFQKTGYNGTTL